MILPADDPTSLSRLYHLNSEPWLAPEADAAVYPVECKRHAPSGEGLSLPAPPETPLRRLLLARRSCRSFADRPLDRTALATLLADGYGLAPRAEVPGAPWLPLRTAPSAGGLFPLELYLMLRAVDGLPAGLYHYDPLEHALELLRGADWEELRPSLLMLDQLAGANAVVFLAGVFARTQKKYGPRGYRYVLIEAGHVAQNLCLAATELGLGSLCLGGFFDAKLDRLLGLQAPREGALYAVAVGHPAP